MYDISRRYVYKLLNNEPVSAMELVGKIYREMDRNGTFKDFPGLCFTRHLLGHSEVSRDPFAFDNMLNFLESFFLYIEDITLDESYKNVVNSMMPMNKIINELDNYCIKACSRKLTNQNKNYFINSLFHAIDEEVVCRFDEKSTLFKKGNYSGKIKKTLDSQKNNTIVDKLNFVCFRKRVFDGIEYLRVELNADMIIILDNSTIVREIESLTHSFEIAKRMH